MESWEAPTNISRIILICPVCGAENVWTNPTILDGAAVARKKCYKCDTFFDAKTAGRKDMPNEETMFERKKKLWEEEQMADEEMVETDEVRYGHPQFYEIMEELMELHSNKNHDYAAGGDPLGNFKRVAKFFSMYPGLDLSDPSIVAMVYAMKQLDAFFWLKCKGHSAKVEGTAERLKDIAVYAPITMILEGEDKDE